MKLSHLLLIIAMAFQPAYSKQMIIKIHLFDASTNEALPFIPVILESGSAKLSSQTDYFGEAKILAEEGDYKLTAKSIGYKDRSISIKASREQNVIWVGMEEARQTLKCVEIIEYSEPIINLCRMCSRSYKKEYSCCCRWNFETVYRDSVTNNEEKILNQNLKAFPNPSKDIITVTSDSELSSVSLYDCTGKLLQSGHAGFQKVYRIDLSSYPSGLYFVNSGDGVVRVVKM